MSATTVVIVLHLDDLADRPSGTATAAGAEPRSFHGWLGLAAAIEALTHPNHAPNHLTKEGEPV
jgi:hypothetical protein